MNFKNVFMRESNSQALQFKHPEFLEYLLILRRRKWLVFLCVLGTVIPVGLFTQFMAPVYEAEATIIYEESKEALFAPPIGQPRDRTASVNLVEHIKSRTLAEEVAQALPQQIAQGYEPPNPLPAYFSQEKFIARQLQKNLRVVIVDDSDILKIKTRANNPTVAKITANTYVERIIDSNLRKKREEISSVRDFVEKQLMIFQDKLGTVEEMLRAFKEENKIFSLSETSAEILKRLTAAETGYDQAKAERAALEQRLRYVRRKIKELTPSLIMTTSPLAAQLKQRLLKLEMEHSSYLVKGATEDQSLMISLKQKIDQVKQELVQELLKTVQQDNLVDPLSQSRNLLQESITLEVDLETYKARAEGVKKIIIDYEAELQTLPKHELELARLIRAQDMNNKIYSMLLEKREEARITEASKIGDIHVIDTAEEPISPVKPKKETNLALGFILGLVIGIGLAFFLEFLDTSLKSEEDVENYVNLPILASIPTINPNGAISFIQKNQHTKASYSEKLISGLQSSSHIYEAYRTLQINFDFVNTDRALKCILVTSPGPGEGKTLTAINMAQIFAKTGFKTLLLDCDLRRPMIHKILRINREPGLTNVLINKVAADSAIQKTEDESLFVLSCGTLPPNPSEILNTQRMRDLLTEFKNEYNILILDSPPLIAVTDAIVLSTEVDGVCLVIKSGRTSQDAARKAKQLLENSRTRIIGTVLNDVDLKNVYGYYKNYYYYFNE